MSVTVKPIQPIEPYELLVKFINTALDDDYGINYESFLYLLDFIAATQGAGVADAVNRTCREQDGRVYLNKGDWIGRF